MGKVPELYQETRYHDWDGHISVKYGLSGHIESCEQIGHVIGYIKKSVKEGKKLIFTNMFQARIEVHSWRGGGLEVSVIEGLGERNLGLHDFVAKLTSKAKE